MSTEPKTAAEALQTWLSNDAYLGDDAMLSQADVDVAAYQVVKLAEEEGLSLIDLVPDLETRTRLARGADEYMSALDDEQCFIKAFARI